MNLLNLTKKDVEVITEVFVDHVSDVQNINDEYITKTLYRMYRLYAHKFKDSHRAILKYKLKMQGHMTPNQISDKFGIEQNNIYGRWRNTIIKRLERYIAATIVYEDKKRLVDMDRLDIINVCDLTKRAVNLIDWYGVGNYSELKSFLETYKPDICQRISGTNIGKETYHELIIAEALLRKDFGKN